MKELIHEVTETYAWEANDGTVFYDKNECEQYEKTAKCAIISRLRELFVGRDDPKKHGGELSEYAVFEGYGCGSEDYLMAVLCIKNENDLYAVNQYAAMVGAKPVPSTMVHECILVGFGYGYEDLYVYGTYGEVVKKFSDSMKWAFGLTGEENAE